MENNFLDLLLVATDERIDSMITETKEYQEENAKRNSASLKFNELNLTDEQKEIANEYIDSISSMATLLNDLHYKQGFLDCVALLKETGII